MPKTITLYTFDEQLPELGRTIKVFFQRNLGLDFGAVGGVFQKCDWIDEEGYPTPEYGVEDMEIDDLEGLYWTYVDDIYQNLFPGIFFYKDWQYYIENGKASIEIIESFKDKYGMTYKNAYYKQDGKTWYLSLVDGNVFDFELL